MKVVAKCSIFYARKLVSICSTQRGCRIISVLMSYGILLILWKLCGSIQVKQCLQPLVIKPSVTFTLLFLLYARNLNSLSVMTWYHLLENIFSRSVKWEACLGSPIYFIIDAVSFFLAQWPMWSQSQWSSWVQVMACRLIGTKPSLESVLTIWQTKH